MRLLSAGLLVVLAATLGASTACSTKSEEQAKPSTEQPFITGEPAGFDDGDVTFAFSVIAHHGQSVSLAALVPDHATNQDLIALAASLSAEQSPDVELMKAFLVQWNENPNDGDRQSEPVAGMVDGPTVAQLQSLNGTEFDTMWLRSMIEHAQGAIVMAEAEIAGGANVDAVATAKRMVQSQQLRITQMQQLLR